LKLVEATRSQDGGGGASQPNAEIESENETPQEHL